MDDDAITPEPRPAWIAGTAEQAEGSLVVTHPFDGNEVATVAVPSADQVERATAAAIAYAPTIARTTADTRADALQQVSRTLAERAEEFTEVITAESGKPLHWAHAEVNRAVTVFRTAADKAREHSGRVQHLDGDPTGAGSVALLRRVPRGPVLAITPFSSPLNVVAHKIATALAVGAPIVVKPSPRTPLSALALGEVLAEAGPPHGSFAVLPVDHETTFDLVRDSRFPVVSFTGSGTVGWSIADYAPRKHTVLELGGNAAAVVLSDWTDLDSAAQRIATFGTYQAGQSCLAVQRVVVQREIAAEFVDKLTAAVRALSTGDPYDPDVRVGPVVDEETAQRITSSIQAAVEAGATLLNGGTREGTTVEPTLLRDVPPEHEVWQREVFGPVLAVAVADGVDEALALVNDSESGLRAGMFTHDLRVAFRASAELEVGGVVIGDVPSYHADVAPHGVAKNPGTRHGSVLAGMDELTQERVTVLDDTPH